jgi:hypothetical protein
MHKVQQRWSRVPIYTNYEGNDVNLRGDNDGDGNVAEDGDEDTPPHDGVDFPSAAAMEQ